MKLAIIRILDVIDTREYTESSDDPHVLIPIPGTGDARTCERCGRTHEIHATVELSDGSRATVGTGCAAKENIALKKEFASRERRAKKIAALRAEIVRREETLKRYDAIRAEVESMDHPAINVAPHPEGATYTCGDAWAIGYRVVRNDTNETMVKRVIRSWVNRRLSERIPHGYVGIEQENVALGWAKHHLARLSRES